jgi:hypothetical protein
MNRVKIAETTADDLTLRRSPEHPRGRCRACRAGGLRHRRRRRWSRRSGVDLMEPFRPKYTDKNFIGQI